MRTAEFGRVSNAEETQLAHFSQNFARDKALFLPGRAIRFDLLRDEARDLVAQRHMFFGEVDGFHVLLDGARVHGYMRNTPKLVFSIGAFSAADRPNPSTMRVSAGSITPSSHNRALA